MTEAEHDPVCGMEAHDKRWTTVYQGREYAFCSGGCRVLFQRDPGARLSGKGEKTRYDLVIIGIETVKQGHPVRRDKSVEDWR